MRKKSKTPKIVLSVVLLVLLIAGLGYFGYVFFKVEDVEVFGNGKFTAVYIKGLAKIDPDTHMLSLDEEKIKANIEEAEPYLEVVAVTKKLPQTVRIEVKERQPKAYVSYAQNYLLTDKDANILEMMTVLPEERLYPVVEGFSITGAALGRQINTEDTFKITVMGEILTALENRTAADTIVTIDLSDVNNIRMTALSGLSIKFGQADKIADKIKWIDKGLAQLTKDGRKTGVLDVTTGTSGTYRLGEDEQTPQSNSVQQDHAADGDGVTMPENSDSSDSNVSQDETAGEKSAAPMD